MNPPKVLSDFAGGVHWRQVCLYLSVEAGHLAAFKLALTDAGGRQGAR